LRSPSDPKYGDVTEYPMRNTDATRPPMVLSRPRSGDIAGSTADTMKRSM
jgi:hypothetical protein